MAVAGSAGAPQQRGAVLRELQARLAQTERWSREQLRAMQFARLDQLLRHAWQEVPFWRERLAAAGYDPAHSLTEDLFTRIPLLTRAEVQSAGSVLQVPRLPAGHGRIHHGATSGSTGQPVAFLFSDIEQLHWEALTLRDHLWHRRDLRARLAAIRATPANGASANWGTATAQVAHTGGAAVLRIDTPVAEQVDWLEREQPAYLLSHPSNIAALAQSFIEQGRTLPSLREVRTVSETVRPELRQLVRAAWNVPVVDMYTAREAGYLALQCPQHEHYHVQEESVLLEVLDAAGQPCMPGQSGRVVVTALHKFATPLIRYDIGDYATPGEPCRCGRTLGVLREVLGRTRNMMRLAGGGQAWPLCPLLWRPDLPGIVQYQFAQTGETHIELRLVVDARWSPVLESRVADLVREKLGDNLVVSFRYAQRLQRSASGKFEDFICLVPAPR